MQCVCMCGGYVLVYVCGGCVFKFHMEFFLFSYVIKVLVYNKSSMVQ